MPRTATPEQIRSSYLKLTARYHPDKHSDNPLQELAAQKLTLLNAAYEVLSDAGRRAEYDALLDADASGRFRAVGMARRPVPWGFKVAVAMLVLLPLSPLIRLAVRTAVRGIGRPLGLVLVCALAAGAVFRWRKRRRR